MVTQFANGVANDDCQEVLIGRGPDGAVLRGSERRDRRRGMGGTDVEVDLGGFGVEVEDGHESESGEDRVKWTTDEMVLRAVRASKL